MDVEDLCEFDFGRAAPPGCTAHYTLDAPIWFGRSLYVLNVRVFGDSSLNQEVFNLPNLLRVRFALLSRMHYEIHQRCALCILTEPIVVLVPVRWIERLLLESLGGFPDVNGR